MQEVVLTATKTVPPAPTQKSLGRQVANTVVTRGVLIVLGVLSSVLVNRALQPEGKGLMLNCLAVTGLAGAISSLGVGRSAIVALGKQVAADDVVAGTVTWLSFVSALATATVIAVGAPWLIEGPAGVDRNMLVAVLIGMVTFQMLSVFQECLTRGKLRISVCNTAALLQAGCYVLGVGALWLAGLISVTAVLAVQACSYIVTLLLYVRANRTFFNGLRLPWDGRLCRELLRIGGTFQGATLLNELNSRTPVLLLTSLAGPAATGLYGTGTGLASMLTQMPYALGTVLFPWSASRPRLEAYAGAARAFRCCLLIMVVAGAVLCVFAEEILHVMYGQAFVPAAWTMRLAMPGVIAGGLSLMIGGYIASHDSMMHYVAALGAGALVLVPLNLLLIPWLGMHGAALTGSVAGLTVLFFVVRRVVRIGEGIWRDFMPSRADVTSLVRGVRGMLASRFAPRRAAGG